MQSCNARCDSLGCSMNRRIRRYPGSDRLWLSLVCLAGCTLPAWVWAAAQTAHQHHPPGSISDYIRSLEDPERDGWQKPDRVVRTLGLRPGNVVADLGAGSGYFTVRLARAVGSEGKVYAVDIEPEMLRYIENRATEEHLGNIQTVLAKPDDPSLPEASLDMVFICDTLHHIANRDRYFPLLAKTLKPGGRLVNIDFHKRPLPFGPPLEMKIAETEMAREAERAGFRLAKKYSYLKYQYFLVFTR